MRPIDADALKDNMFHYAAPEMVWDRGDIEHKINEMPTIDAIPVAWLQKKRKDASEGDSLDVGIAEVLDMWEKEQEEGTGGEIVAEFQVVAKELERMCNTYHAARGKCCTDECPLYCEDLCYAQAMVHVHGDDACNLEKVVMLWAAEHPVVYPTWVEYLVGIDVIPHEIRLKTADALMDTHLLKPIPANIAQKLGIEPKEG